MIWPHTPAAPWLDAIALVNAQLRHDSDAVEQVVTTTTDIDGLVLVLGQMVQTAVRTHGRTVEQYLEVQTERLLKLIDHDSEVP